MKNSKDLTTYVIHTIEESIDGKFWFKSVCNHVYVKTLIRECTETCCSFSDNFETKNFGKINFYSNSTLIELYIDGVHKIISISLAQDFNEVFRTASLDMQLADIWFTEPHCYDLSDSSTSNFEVIQTVVTYRPGNLNSIKNISIDLLNGTLAYR